MPGAKHHPGGFTLLEMVVATALFTVFIITAADIYLITNGRQNRLTDRQQLVESVRPAVEMVSRDIRQSAIDYSGNWLAAGPLDQLHLLTADGTGITYRFAAAPECATACLLRQTSTQATPTVMTVHPLVAVTGTWRVQPLADPFLADSQGQYAANQQPQVTLFMELQSLEPSAETLWLQTSVVTRTYGR